MLTVVRAGGLGTGGFNFDAKLRRESTSLADLFYGHISGMDALARGLRNAAALVGAGQLDGLRAGRYASWTEKGGIGEKIRGGKVRCGGRGGRGVVRAARGAGVGVVVGSNGLRLAGAQRLCGATRCAGGAVRARFGRRSGGAHAIGRPLLCARRRCGWCRPDVMRP